ncbi:hypothetical protein LEP1GSC084_2068 [Leptospira interrogans serovar Medanensis str. L0448]|uniref:Uncharacterized protein n=1 Tax=Leptospira interrogans serovar Lora str. TE 1992 TaxID=1193028 RepID=M3E639_LEPIR|nr:hypothetical protein LEP1GSC087_3716 [Leptospira interrogans serovar Bataviae str. L1111]EKR82858.1 hypothetical protein LEP1GSC099_4267 [Leptospira interrogans str. UI 08452]EMF42390.1 hypothetical protein LEP1GSC067_0512 [Leptospira interrogans serovar Lora str. TE 1992]EMK06436.1 hypothetical protein LEP1GSC166_3750 [Leptospira kirschneri]EMN08635.1 hypothetical protein LEP1GSC053_2218 [Leptospira interrogans serovar Muenchen str. Brem 129]EMN34033.1 hypothetical protein LEP1GSC084_2068 
MIGLQKIWKPIRYLNSKTRMFRMRRKRNDCFRINGGKIDKVQ